MFTGFRIFYFDALPHILSLKEVCGSALFYFRTVSARRAVLRCRLSCSSMGFFDHRPAGDGSFRSRSVSGFIGRLVSRRLYRKAYPPERNAMGHSVRSCFVRRMDASFCFIHFIRFPDLHGAVSSCRNLGRCVWRKPSGTGNPPTRTRRQTCRPEYSAGIGFRSSSLPHTKNAG